MTKWSKRSIRWNADIKNEESSYMADMVNSPSHYKRENGSEVIEVIMLYAGRSFLLGNVFKYLLRAERKGNL